MAPVTWAAVHVLEARFGTQGLFARAVTCLVPVAAGTLVYAGLTRAMGVPEAQALGRMVLGRLARRSEAA